MTPLAASNPMASRSIFTRSLGAGPLPSARELISDEVSHLHGRGQSRWRTNPFMATCRTVSGFLFVIVMALYFLDPFRFAVQKSQAINAYLYLSRFGNPTEVEPLRTCGIFTERDWRQLAHRAQLAESDSSKVFFVSTAAARDKVQETVDFMHECDALSNGQIGDVTALTTIRYYLFRQFGIIPPREWLSLNPVIETD